MRMQKKSLSESAISVSSNESGNSYVTDIINSDESLESLDSHESLAANTNMTTSDANNKTRKKREELSISATKSIKKEKVEIIVNFN